MQSLTMQILTFFQEKQHYVYIRIIRSEPTNINKVKTYINKAFKYIILCMFKLVLCSVIVTYFNFFESCLSKFKPLNVRNVRELLREIYNNSTSTCTYPTSDMASAAPSPG